MFEWHMELWNLEAKNHIRYFLFEIKFTCSFLEKDVDTAVTETFYFFGNILIITDTVISRISFIFLIINRSHYQPEISAYYANKCNYTIFWPKPRDEKNLGALRFPLFLLLKHE